MAPEPRAAPDWRRRTSGTMRAISGTRGIALMRIGDSVVLPRSYRPPRSRRPRSPRHRCRNRRGRSVSISMRGIGRSRIAVSGSTSVAAQRTMRLTTLSRAWARSRSRAPSRLNSCHAGQPVDVEVAAEAQRIDRRAGGVFQLRHRREIDDRDHLLRDVGEAVARRVQHLGRAAQLVGAMFGEESLDCGAAFRRAQVAARRLAVLVADGQHMTGLRRTTCAAPPAARCASASGSGFSGKYCGLRRIEAGGPVLDRVEPVARQRGARRQGCTRGSRSGVKPLHRIAVDRLDFAAIGRGVS